MHIMGDTTLGKVCIWREKKIDKNIGEALNRTGIPNKTKKKQNGSVQ